MVKINMDIYVDSQARMAPTIAHVKDWLEKVSLLNLPDDYPLYALELGLSCDVHESSLSSILCGDCSPQSDVSDILITTHDCQFIKNIAPLDS